MNFYSLKLFTMKQILIFVLLFFTSNMYATNEIDSILNELYSVLERKSYFAQEKEKRIQDVKKLLNMPDITENQYYTINQKLYNEFYTYQTDSAIKYLNHNLQIANNLNNITYVYETTLNLAYMYWQTGNFFESVNFLENLDRSQVSKLSETMVINYLEAYKRLYRYYAEYQTDTNNEYFMKSSLYRDSLLNILSPETKAYQIMTAEKLLDLNNTAKAKNILDSLLMYSYSEDHDRAILTNILANIYRKEGNIEMQKKYYAISAICDIKNGIKENTSTQALALILFQENDIDNAYKCVQSSIDRKSVV